MNSYAPTQSKEVAVRHWATSAQPPHATSPFLPSSSSQRAPHPFPWLAVLGTPGVPLEGLRCFPAAYPLPATMDGHRKNRTSFLGDFK